MNAIALENHLLDCPLCDDAVDGYSVLAEGTKVQNAPQPAIRRKLFTPLRVAAAVVVLIGGAWMFNLVLGDSSPEALFSSAYQLYPSDLDVNFRGRRRGGSCNFGYGFPTSHGAV
jgi:hypothetical protein